MLNRREALSLGLTTTVAAAVRSHAAQAAADDVNSLQIVDTNISLFQWPFRRFALDDADAMVAKLRSLGITQAWAGSFEGLLHRDLSGVNERLVQACGQRPELIAMGSINPALPDWEEDLRRCIEEHAMHGIRIHPNYHGYTLDDSRFEALLQRTAAAHCLVQLAVSMEDERTQNNVLRAADVNLELLVEIMSGIDGVRIQLLNFKPRASMLAAFGRTPGLFFDTSRVEGTDGVPQLVQSLPAGRVLFGSHAPFLIPESALIRVHESGQLSDSALRDVFGRNAQGVLAEGKL